MPTVVLAADVGGTNTKLALAQCDGRNCAFLKRSIYPSARYATLESAVDAFLAEPGLAPLASNVASACFAVAGPVENGSARLTNLSWRIDEKELAQRFSIPRVCVVNDFAAAGLGIEKLGDSDLLTLQAGTAVHGADRVVIGAGTGLGVAMLTWSGDSYRVRPSEAGHSDFAPVDQTQDDLLHHLREQFGHVSIERVVSGPGLPRIFSFLRARADAAVSPELLDALANGNPAGAITEFALAQRDDLAVRALDLFVSAYGAFAGNMALAALAHGGVYVAGGIAPKIASKLQDGSFIRAFTAKGRFRVLLETFPVRVVMNEQVGLLGALAEAARIARA